MFSKENSPSARKRARFAVVGSGPAALMAAEVLAAGSAGREGAVTVFEKRKAPGRKLLVAGSSGLNITYDAPSLEEFVAFYGESGPRLRPMLQAFGPADWRRFIEGILGIRTFKGTSRRWFVEAEGMKAAGLLKAWVNHLRALGVAFEFDRELTDFETNPMSLDAEGGTLLTFANGTQWRGDRAVLALGGGSWEPSEKPLRWPAIFKNRGISFRDFEPSNVGYQVTWPEGLVREADRKPIKNARLRTARGERGGELLITSYGLEGTPVYFAGCSGPARLDLKPDLDEAALLERLQGGKENLSPIRRVQKLAGLCEASRALMFHLTPESERGDLRALAHRIKNFPLELGAAQPLDEAISSAGGILWSELDSDLALVRAPSVHLAGEMVDWDAPTGGFLIQACVAQGAWAGKRALSLVLRGSSP